MKFNMNSTKPNYFYNSVFFTNLINLALFVVVDLSSVCWVQPWILKKKLPTLGTLRKSGKGNGERGSLSGDSRLLI